MRILEVRPSRDARHVAKLDIELAPGVKAVDVSVIKKLDGTYRVFGSGVRFDRAVADDLARAAVAAGGRGLVLR